MMVDHFTMLTLPDNAFVNTGLRSFVPEKVAHTRSVLKMSCHMHVVRAPKVSFVRFERCLKKTSTACCHPKRIGTGSEWLPLGAYTEARAALVPGSSFEAYETLVAGGRPADGFAATRTVFIHKSCEVDDLGRIVRPLVHCTADLV